MTYKKPSIRDALHLVSPEERPEIGEAETSANFDLEDVLPFLESLHVLGDIYTPIGRLSYIAADIAEVSLDETRTFESVGGSRTKMHLLTIEAYMDDIYAPDLRFIGTAEMIAHIDAKLMALDQDD